LFFKTLKIRIPANEAIVKAKNMKNSQVGSRSVDLLPLNIAVPLTQTKPKIISNANKTKLMILFNVIFIIIC
jgi:hypothetical protein